MHLYDTFKARELIKKTGGIIRSSGDLLLVRETINTSMQLAICYIALSLVFLAVLAFFVISGYPFSAAIGQLFTFGIVTLPMGLICKHFEDKIRKMEVRPPDPVLNEAYFKYLTQWKEARFKLPD
jgi:hypothetical protein